MGKFEVCVKEFWNALDKIEDNFNNKYEMFKLDTYYNERYGQFIRKRFIEVEATSAQKAVGIIDKIIKKEDKEQSFLAFNKSNSRDLKYINVGYSKHLVSCNVSA